MWMTSASELFHNQRYHFGLRHNAVDISGFDSSFPDSNSSSSHQHRTINRRHNHHYSSQNNRREHRHDFDVCDPAARRIHRRRLDHSLLIFPNTVRIGTTVFRLSQSIGGRGQKILTGSR